MSANTIDFGAGSTGYMSATDAATNWAATRASLADISTKIQLRQNFGETGLGSPFSALSADGGASSSALAFTPAQNISFASQAIGSILGNIARNRANKQSARALSEQAGIYSQMSGIQLGQAAIAAQGAGMYVRQAAAAADLGRGNARNIRLAAAQLDLYEQLQLRESVLQARSRIGQGRAAFAGNGVLVDSGSAALWEQDEAADAALERLDIMQQFEDRSWTYLMQANKAEAEGYAAAAQQMGNAAGAAGQAAQMAGNAYASALQAASARAQAARLRRKKSWGGTIGAVVGVVGGAALAAASGGALAPVSAMMAGGALGGTAGTAADTFA